MQPQAAAAATNDDEDRVDKLKVNTARLQWTHAELAECMGVCKGNDEFCCIELGSPICDMVRFNRGAFRLPPGMTIPDPTEDGCIYMVKEVYDACVKRYMAAYAEKQKIKGNV